MPREERGKWTEKDVARAAGEHPATIWIRSVIQNHHLLGGGAVAADHVALCARAALGAGNCVVAAAAGGLDGTTVALVEVGVLVDSGGLDVGAAGVRDVGDDSTAGGAAAGRDLHTGAACGTDCSTDCGIDCDTDCGTVAVPARLGGRMWALEVLLCVDSQPLLAKMLKGQKHST